ncbi:MAG: hypothetical protein M3179_06940 [Actinomycetota bacterium]|nr:hypothetical protein [Actinomycetota bacterium]
MRRKRFAVLIAGVAGTLPLSVPAATADAPANENNCLGAAFSGLVPEETSTAPPTYGETTRAQAREGIRDDLLTAATKGAASCGSP